jgi:membrane protein
VASGADRAPGGVSPGLCWDIVKSVWTSTNRHNIGFLAAGVAFFGFLSLAPGLALIVMVYGLVADPATIFANMIDIIRLVPAQAAQLINEQLANLIKTVAARHAAAIVPAVIVALYGASGATRGLVASLNMIHDTEETRSLIRLTATSIVIAAGAVFVACLGLLAAAATAMFKDVLIGPVSVAVVRIATWLIAGLLATAAIALIYRYGPARRPGTWRMLSLGSLIATLLWLLVSVGFGWYVSMARYDTTYGSLGTVVALIMWLYVSAYALLLGAFFEAEIERRREPD